MEDDFFDRPKAPKATVKKSYPNLVTNELLDRLEQVESGGKADAVNKESGAEGAYQFLPNTTKMLLAKGIKFDPKNKTEARSAARTYLQQLVDQNEGDVEKALAQYGGFIKKDPTNYVNMVLGKQPIGGTKQESDFFDRPVAPTIKTASGKEEVIPPTPEEKIANQAAFGIYPRVAGRREVIEKAQKPSTEGMGGSLAAIADVAGNLPSQLLGLAGYGGLRYLAGRSPESAAETAYGTAGLISQPFGKLTGTAGTPAYEKDVLTAPLRQLGQYTQTKAKEISKATGIPEQDVEFAINAGLLAAPKVAKTVAPPVTRAIENVGGAVQDVRAQMAQQLAAKQAAQATQPTMQSGGAMAAVPENILRANIDSALANASPELQTHIKSQNPAKVNIPALETRALEEKHGVNLLSSQRTGDLMGYTDAWNNRTKNGLINDFEQQPKQLANAFEQSKRRHAPDISSEADASELGQYQINGLLETDKSRLQNIQNKYLTLKNSYNELKKKLGLSESNDLPLDGKLFVENSKKTLNSEMFTEDARKSIDELLDKIDNKNGVMTFQEFTTLDKRLSELSKFGKGSEKEAARLTRNHLNNMELTEDAAPLYPLLKDAKNSAKERFDVIDSNPAYAKAIGEGKDLEGGTSQGESLNAAKFHRQYVSNATPEAIRRLKAELPEGHIAHQAITVGELERAKRAITNANESRVKSDTFANFVKNNKPVLREALPPEAMQDVMEIGLLNSKIGKPEAGGFNYSNSYTAMIGELAKQGLLTLGEAKLALATGGYSVAPVAGVKSLLEKFDKNAFVNNQRNPFGGLTKE